jgi:hypothetical protein
MENFTRTYGHSLLPIIVRQIRQHVYCPREVESFLAHAREVLWSRQERLATRRRRFLERERSRAFIRTVAPCFECEELSLLLALEALNGLEAFLRTGHPGHLAEALSDFHLSEQQFERVVRLRKVLPATYQEGLQKAG